MASENPPRKVLTPKKEDAVDASTQKFEKVTLTGAKAAKIGDDAFFALQSYVRQTGTQFLDISTVWQKALQLHLGIRSDAAKLDRLKGAERIALENKLRADLAELRGPIEEHVRVVAESKVRSSTEGIAEYQTLQGMKVRESTLRAELERKNVEARQNLTGVSKRRVEERVAELEQELRSIEELRHNLEKPPERAERLASLEPSAVKAELEEAVAAMESYEGEPHYPVPARSGEAVLTPAQKPEPAMESYIGDPNYPVPALSGELVLTPAQKRMAANQGPMLLEDRQLVAEGQVPTVIPLNVTQEGVILNEVTSKTNPEISPLEQHRLTMTAAGDAYFAALKELKRKGLTANDAVPEVEQYYALKHLYDAARSEYYRESIALGADLPTLQKEVFFDVNARETETKVAALSERKQGTFTRALSAYGGINKSLEKKYGKIGAIAIRTAATTVLVTTAFAATGGLSTLAALGYGGARGVKALITSLIYAGNIELVGGVGGMLAKGSIEKAQSKLKAFDSSIGTSLNAGDIADVDAQRRVLADKASGDYASRRIAVAKVLISMGVGAGLAQALTENLPPGVVTDAPVKPVDTAPPMGADTAVLPDTTKPAVAQPEAPTALPVETSPAPETPALPAPAVPEGLDDMSAVVDEIHEVTAKRGDGAIRMLDRLHDDLVAKGITPNSPGISAEMKAVLEADTPAEVAELAKKLGFYDPDNVNESAVITRGASLKFEDGKLVLTQAGGTPQVVSESSKYTGAFDANNPRPTPVERTETVSTRDTQTAIPSTRVTPELTVSSADASYDTDPRYSQEEVRARVLAQREPIAPEPQAQPSAAADAAPSVERVPEPIVQEEPQDVQSTNPESVINKNGVEVNSTRAAVYADRNGIVIVHGGTVAERAAEAARYLVENPKAEIYYDSSSVNPVTGQVEPHLSRLKALPNGSLPLTAVDERDVLGADMRGRRLPAVDDLYRKIVDYP